MKKRIVLMLLAMVIGVVGALDTESYLFTDHLLRLKNPGQPELIDDGVLFTAPSVYRRVGIAFAHEGFAKVYWFRKLLVVRDTILPEEWEAKKPPEIYHDSGILFHAYTVPQGLEELEYRLIIDGLWTTDPLNPLRRMDANSGTVRSVVSLSAAPQNRSAGTERREPSPGYLNLHYRGPPGEIVTVAGNFNRWDPFMYEMRETSPGNYSLALPLPPGTYHYVFYHRGERFLDPNNHRRAYTREGSVASEVVINLN